MTEEIEPGSRVNAGIGRMHEMSDEYAGDLAWWVEVHWSGLARCRFCRVGVDLRVGPCAKKVVPGAVLHREGCPMWRNDNLMVARAVIEKAGRHTNVIISQRVGSVAVECTTYFEIPPGMIKTDDPAVRIALENAAAKERLREGCAG